MVDGCMEVVAANVGGKCNSLDAFDATIQCVSEVSPNWSFLFISEFDYSSECRFDTSVSEHKIWRHYPGPGSRAMAWVARNSCEHLVRRCTWEGRAGSLHVNHAYARPGQTVNLLLVGVHAAHGDFLHDSLSEASILIGRRPRHSEVVAIGDWNVDMLPTLALDPFSDLPLRSSHHSERRDAIEAWASGSHLSLFLPQEVVSVQGGVWAKICSDCPVTRLPVGEQDHKPSLLDYAWQSCSLILNASIAWLSAMADHALVSYQIRHVCSRRHFSKSRWFCRDDHEARAWSRDNFVCPDVPEIDAMYKHVKHLQCLFSDNRTCAERRRSRMPFALRCAYAQLAKTVSENQRKTLQSRAWALRKQWVARMHDFKRNRCIDKGGVLFKPKKLHSLDVLIVHGCDDQPDQFLDDPETWEQPLVSFFGKKWGCHKLQQRINCMDFVMSQENSKLDLDPTHVDVAFSRIRRQNRLDLYGLCVYSFALVFQSSPLQFLRWLSSIMASTPSMATQKLHARCFGKKASKSAPADVRAIVPLTALMQIVDSVLTYVLEPLVSQLFPLRPGLFIGCRPYTQGLDIGFGAQLWIEKALDTRSGGALAQSDIKTFFDANPLLKCVLYLCDRGVPRQLLAAVLRHQLFTQVYLSMKGHNFLVHNRSQGGLTGSRLAMLLGRIPVEASFLRLWDSLAFCCFRAGIFKIVGGAYVDNLYFFGSDVHAAVHNAELFHEELKSRWHLDIKDGSRTVLLPAGADTLDLPPDWEYPCAAVFLGYIVQHDGGVRSAWARCRAKIWQRFFAICKEPGWARLSLSRKCNHIERSIWSLLSFYCGTWPPQRQIAAEVDAVQRRMFAITLKVRPILGEPCITFVRRRNRVAREACVSTGLWSDRWFRKAQNWDQHLRRDLAQQLLHVRDDVPVERTSTSFSWGPALLEFQGLDFLNERRVVTRSDAFSNRVSIRTGLRRGQRRVHPRWSSAISDLKARA